jgi:hypothetical protein
MFTCAGLAAVIEQLATFPRSLQMFAYRASALAQPPHSFVAGLPTHCEPRDEVTQIERTAWHRSLPHGNVNFGSHCDEPNHVEHDDS